MRSPKHHGVTDASLEGSHRLCLVHVLEHHISVLQAEDLKPLAHGEMARGHCGDEEGLAFDGLGASVDLGEFGVEAFGLQDGAVGPHHNAVGLGLIVADGKQNRAVAEGTHVGWDSAHAGDHPLLGGQGFHLRHAGVKEVELQIQPFFLVPALLLGIPGNEGLMFRLPGRVEHKRFLSMGDPSAAKDQ